MRRVTGGLVLALGAAVGAAGGYWYARQAAGPLALGTVRQATAAADRKVLYYRDPSGAPYWSATPKKDAAGRNYLPVYADEEVSFEPAAKQPTKRGSSGRILRYRNPMGLPDTSPVPKKDWMGMDYIPVYEGEEQDSDNTVRVRLDKIQRSGVRTEVVGLRNATRHWTSP
jgi:Cu(I)/Ag(I) efflux system membrane fusion protein